jgi:5-methylcytosine-specific restriction endonuclease McrA
MTRLQRFKPGLSSLPAQLSTVTAGSWRSEKKSSTARGYGYKWQQARAGYLLTHPYCAYCLREAGIDYDQEAVKIGNQCMKAGLGSPFATVVDHQVPHRGDMKLFWDKSNWQSLCATHHSRDKQREESNGM